MKTSFLFSVSTLLLIALLSCSKSKGDDNNKMTCNLPNTPVPAALVGNWANGYNSATSIVDAYSGAYVGNAFQSGKYFHFSADGKYAEFYYLANAGTTYSTATKAIGTVEFIGNDAFIFHGCKAHYKGWQNGRLTIDRDATPAEVANTGITQKYYYSMVTSGGTTYMQIKFDPAQTTGTSFRQVP